MKKFLIVQLLAIFASFSAFPQAGTLDDTFSSDGKALFDVGNSHDVANALVVLPDSSTILGGAAILTSSFDGFLMKISEAGEQDMSFGTNGYIAIDYGIETYVKAMALTSDGKVLVAGLTYITGENSNIFVAKFDQDGILDATFGTNGYDIYEYSTSEEICETMAIQPDGKIVVAGRTSLGDFSQLLFMRLNANGTLDTGFGTNGFTEIDASIQDESIRGIDFMSNGDIVGTGYGYQGNPLWGELAIVAKIDSNGSPVSGFGTNGVLIPAVFTTYSIGWGIKVINDEMLVTGYQDGNGGRDLFLTKLNSSGVAVPAFATNGISLFNLNVWDIGIDLILQGDGKILVSGTSGSGASGDSEFLIMRYLATGTLDLSFNTVGYNTTNFRSDWDEPYGFGMQPDGKLVLAGVSGGLTSSGDNKIPMARYLNDYSPFHAGFIGSPTIVCQGSSVDFTDLSGGNIVSYSWTFEGGTPSTSTQQNPQVTYNTLGDFDVQLIVTNSVSEKDTLLRENYIHVIATPAQADQPSGETALCTGTTAEYSIAEVLYAENYNWELSPAGAGVLTVEGTSATLEVSDTWTGDFTIKVRATNSCGIGEWSNNLEGTVYKTPDSYDLIGGGEFCEGDPGLEIELNDSETGVDYELYKNDVTTGIIIAGTGESISFGIFTEAGNYTCTGFTDYCSAEQFGEVSIIVSLLPAQLSMPAGMAEVCNNEENEYTTSGGEETDNIIWELSPENAGEISIDGMTAIVMWNPSFTGDVTLSVYAENSCGPGPVSDPLEILVMASPAPEVSGDDLVCKEEVSVYSTENNAGSSYGWEVVGGAITSGQGSSQVTVTWGDVPGMAYVIVSESLEMGCSAIDTLAVTIDDCTGIEDNLYASDVKLFPNPVRTNLNLEFTAQQGEKVIVAVFNSIGQTVMQEQYIATGVKQSSKFDTEALPKGLYVVKITTASREIWNGKFERN